MARVTIENCLPSVNGHFELVILASERAKQILAGKRTETTKKGIKTHVTALREIEEKTVSIEALRSNIHDRINNIALEDRESDHDEINDLVEELQTSTFIPGELEEINEVNDLFDAESDSKSK